MNPAIPTDTPAAVDPRVLLFAFIAAAILALIGVILAVADRRPDHEPSESSAPTITRPVCRTCGHVHESETPDD